MRISKYGEQSQNTDEVLESGLKQVFQYGAG
jgi:hypothetical protein